LDINNDFRGLAMLSTYPRFLATLTLILVPLVSAVPQVVDSTKSVAPQESHTMVPSHPSTDTVKTPSGPDTDTIFSSKDWMVIETHHRMYPAFLQVDTVKPRQKFQLGDDGPFAEVIKFVPDLKVTMKGERIKTSDTLYNPAALLRVTIPDTAIQKDSVLQESWAFFYSGAPHFSRQAFFAFKLVDFNVVNPKYVKPPEGK
jgi:hypothetical protein